MLLLVLEIYNAFIFGDTCNLHPAVYCLLYTATAAAHIAMRACANRLTCLINTAQEPAAATPPPLRLASTDGEAPPQSLSARLLEQQNQYRSSTRAQAADNVSSVSDEHVIPAAAATAAPVEIVLPLEISDPVDAERRWQQDKMRLLEEEEARMFALEAAEAEARSRAHTAATTVSVNSGNSNTSSAVQAHRSRTPDLARINSLDDALRELDGDHVDEVNPLGNPAADGVDPLVNPAFDEVDLLGNPAVDEVDPLADQLALLDAEENALLAQEAAIRKREVSCVVCFL